MPLQTLLTVFVGIAAAAPSPANPLCGQALPISAVEKVSGLRGIAISEAGPMNCVYRDARNHPLLSFDPPAESAAAVSFAGYKSHPTYLDNQSPVNGLGDEAFTSGALGNVLVVRTGERFFILRSGPAHARPGGGFSFTRDQLIKLARTVLAAN